MPQPVELTWYDNLQLAAALSGLAEVRSRFLPFGPLPSRPRGPSPAPDDDGHERTTALARAGLYNFLAMAFAEPPSAEFTDRLYRSHALALLAAKGLGSDELVLWGEGLSQEERAADLAEAYARLFIRSTQDSAPPLASEYLQGVGDSAHPLSLGPVAEAAEASYREAGLVVSGAGPYPPHHLAIELQFMHHCAAREATAWSEGSSAAAEVWSRRQQRFLKAHLLPWIGAFSHRVRVCGAHPYYRALADLTTLYLVSDVRHLSANRHVTPSPAAQNPPGIETPVVNTPYPGRARRPDETQINRR